MTLTVTQTLVTIAAIALGVQISRWLPFAAFSGKKELPEFIKYLGRVLPPALMGLLVVYCFKNTPILTETTACRSLSQLRSLSAHMRGRKISSSPSAAARRCI